jgi:NADH-quinone oxidoreductase subunit L
MVPFAVLMIFVYSVGYHNYGQPRGTILGVPNHGKEDPLFSRFFALMSLFAGAMLLLVVADNLLLLFVGWEIMGFCSYALIGFWYAREYHLGPDDIPHISPRKAAVKAFMTTRVADVIMLLGIVFFYRVFGTLNFSEAFTATSLETAHEAIRAGGIGLMALLIFAGTVGKSAQWPLHVWLPDAMEGPTPVSATIHAAAMVSAGVYLIIRIFPLIAVALEGNPGVGWIIAGIGAFTALMSATIAVAQNDVKGVLAYSTISQLGFMVAAVGIGAYIAAAFHLITHAFFKALLFLASGSVIHGMEHGAEHVHDHHTDPQDMRYMGGLKDKMPITFWTFVIGGMALAGLPLVTAGFWSKDEILADAWFQGSHGNPLAMVVFWVLAIAAFLTAFYTTRQISMTFLGQPRTPLAEHAHESNRYMTLPLMLLSIFAIGAGWFGIPEDFPVLGPMINNNWFHHFVGATVEHTLAELHELGLVGHALETLEFNPVPLIASVVVALGGIFVGWWIYGRNPLQQEEKDPLITSLGPLHTFLQNKWYWDELYQTLFIGPTVRFSERVVYEIVDKGLIDGTLHLVARVVYRIGRMMKSFEDRIIGGGVDWLKDQLLAVAYEFRQLQTGKIQEYTLVSMLIASALALVVLAINYGWLQPLFEIFNNL